jgi:hypothetical protein
MMNFTNAGMDLVVKLSAAVSDTRSGNRTKGYVIV